MNPNIPLNTTERVAVARAMGSAQAVQELSASLKPGTYQGEVIIKVKFDVQKEPNYETTPTVSVFTKAVFAMAVKKAGALRGQILDIFADAAMEVMAGEGNMEEALLAADPELAKYLVGIQANVLAKLPKATRTGRTLVKAEVAKLAAPTTTENAA